MAFWNDVGDWLFGKEPGDFEGHTDPNNARLQGGDRLRQTLQGRNALVSNRQAPTAQGVRVGRVAQGSSAQLASGPQNQFRAQEMALANRLTGVASGQQAGAGEMATIRQGQRAIAQQQAVARMGRGSNAAGAARTAARNTGDIALNVAGQSSQAALSDQAAANAQLTGVLGQGRGADINFAGQNAQLRQGMNLANMDAQNQRVFQQAGLDQARSLADQQARLATMGMNDQASIAYLAQLYNIDVAEMQARIQQEGMRFGAAQASGQGVFPYIVQGAGQVGAAAAASDRNLKKDTRRVSRSIDDMLDKLKAHSWRYKDEGAHGEGRRAGVMTQDLEGSEAGRRVIREKPDGKYIDVNAGISAALAAVARLNERVREVEKANK